MPPAGRLHRSLPFHPRDYVNYARCRMRLAAAVLIAAVALVSASGDAADVEHRTVIISDLHLGVGHLPDHSERCDPKLVKAACEPPDRRRNSVSSAAGETWNKFEDFRWESEFARFLDVVDKEGDHQNTLVLDGDTFELWQSSECDCRYEDKNWGCTEAEALERLKRVMSQHRGELQDLARFAANGNRVVFIPGNHDAALALPKVVDALVGQFRDFHAEVRVESSGYWIANDKVYIEHGHEIGHDANRIEGWPEHMLVKAGDCDYLRRSWGERFVQEFYD